MIMISAAILALCAVRTEKDKPKDTYVAGTEPSIGLFGPFFSEAKLTVPITTDKTE